MDPPRRLEAELDPEDPDHDQGAQPQDDEHGGTVAGIVAAQIEVAHRAATDHAQHAAEQPAAAAPRAGAAQRDIDGRLTRPFSHWRLRLTVLPRLRGGGPRRAGGGKPQRRPWNG